MKNGHTEHNGHHGHNDNHHAETMKAIQFEDKAFHVSVNTVAIPKIIKPNDAVIRVTSTGICGQLIQITRIYNTDTSLRH